MEEKNPSSSWMKELKRRKFQYSAIWICFLLCLVYLRLIPTATFSTGHRHGQARILSNDGQHLANSLVQDTAIESEAYVFHTVDNFDACSAVINIDRLRNKFHSTRKIIVIVGDETPDYWFPKFTRLDVTILPLGRLADSKGHTSNQEIEMKLLVFGLHQYIPHLQRIVVLESDSLILKSLDHLFQLPIIDFAAPRKYWDQDPAALSPAVMVANLSDRLLGRIQKFVKSKKGVQYEIDVISDLFGSTALVLPGSYATQHSHWDDNTLPEWWPGVEPYAPDHSKINGVVQKVLENGNWYSNNAELSDRFEKPPKPSATGKAKVKMARGKDDPAAVLLKNKAIQQSTFTAQQAQDERRTRLATQLADLHYNHTSILSFGDWAKPWRQSRKQSEQSSPYAHELYHKQMAIWRRKAIVDCPKFDQLGL